MEKAELNKLILMVVIFCICCIQKVTGVSETYLTNYTKCAFSLANIDFNISLDAADSIVGKRTWLLHGNKIAESNGITLTPVASYSSRLTAYGTYGISLSSVNVADTGTYTYIVVLSPSGNPITATATLSVQEPPNAGCSVDASQSGIIVTCSVSGSCGTPVLEPDWENETGISNIFHCDKQKTYRCCATSAALKNCYTGSPDNFCKVYSCSANGNKSADDCPLKVVLGYGLGVGLCTATICIICHVFTMIWIKIVMNIPDKKELQKSIPKGKDVTNTAFVHGFGISGVQWTGPQGNKLTSEKYNIQYDKKKGTITLKIKDLQINDSGLYTCHACESLVQDSVKLSVYEKIAVYFDIGETFRQHGSDVKIICSVYGSENKSVHWTGQEENILTNGGGHTITPYDSNTNESSLSIRNSSNTKAEGYICQVLFKESEVSVKMYVRITVSVIGLLIDIGKIILSVPASENESRKWIGPHDNILTDTEKYAIVPYDSKTNQSHLTIKTFSVNDHGSYTCQSKNNSGTSPKNTITITTNVAIDPSTYAYKFMLGFGIIICVGCIACVVICVKIGNVCALKLGLGLGLGLGIPIIGCIIVIVIWVKKVLKPPQAPENQRNIKSGSAVPI